jgi:hypothetical protein
MTGNYQVVQCAFWLTWLTAVVTIWLSLVILSAIARRLWTLFCALMVGAFLFFGYRYLCPDLVFGPQKVTFGDFPFAREMHTFSIENKSGRDLYYIQLALKAIGQSPQADDYEFDIPSGYRKPISSGSDFADTIGLACKTDTPGVGMLIFQIFHLHPNERREFTLTHKTSMKGLVEASVTHFTYDESPTIGDPHSMEQRLIYPGETIHCYWETAWPADGSEVKKNWSSTIIPDQSGSGVTK